MTTIKSTLPNVTPNKKISGPRAYPLIGSLPSMGKDMLGFFRSIPQKYGGVARLQLGPANFVLVSDPVAVKHCLIDNNKNYPKNYESTARVFGDSILTSNGDFWLQQRRIMQPAFHQREIAKYASVMVEHSRGMVEKWKRGHSKPISVLHEMMGVTQTVILQVMFSANIGERTTQMAAAFDEVVGNFNRNFIRAIPPLFKDRKFERAINQIDEFLFDLIKQRRANLEGAPKDMLTTLLTAVDPETNEGMTDKQLRDEMLTLYFAGHETTATTLAWTLYFLTREPEIEAKVRQEIKDVVGDRTPTIEDWQKLTYTRMVIDETLRLRSPAWMFTRIAKENDIVDGYEIKKGQMMMFSPYVTHHMPQYWQNPDQFNPERFAPNADANRPKSAYMPFSLGPRMCIGNIFALVEATLMLVTMLQGGKLVPLSTTPQKPQSGVLLRPPSNMQMRFEPF
jgi:cytochrome P450